VALTRGDAMEAPVNTSGNEVDLNPHRMGTFLCDCPERIYYAKRQIDKLAEEADERGMTLKVILYFTAK